MGLVGLIRPMGQMDNAPNRKFLLVSFVLFVLFVLFVPSLLLAGIENNTQQREGIPHHPQVLKTIPCSGGRAKEKLKFSILHAQLLILNS